MAAGHICFMLTALVMLIPCETTVKHYSKVKTCTDPSSTATSRKTAVSITACAVLCTGDAYCKSYSVRLTDNTRTCYIHRGFLSSSGCSAGDLVHYNSQSEILGCLNGGVYDGVKGSCKCINSYVGDRCERFMEDCVEGRQSSHYAGIKGIFTIHPKIASHPFKVYCEMNNGKLFLAQRRIKQPFVNFTRGWEEYRDGFGDLLGKNFWLGLERMHLVTSSRAYKLIITAYFADLPKEHRQHYYDNFRVSSASSGYSFTTSAHKANGINGGIHRLDDCLWSLQGQPFSTVDRDNDASSEHCAMSRSSGWWYKDCSLCNPTGEIQPDPDLLASSDPKFMSWPMSGNYAARILQIFVKEQ